MKEIFVNKTTQLVVPDTATKINVIHEWGDTVVSPASVVTTYDFTPDSMGVHKVIWLDNTTPVSTEYYNVAVAYADEDSFFEDYPELEAANGDKFVSIERRARGVVEAYTGQRFGPFISKTLELPGDGGDSLELPYRINSLDEITDIWGADFTGLVDIAPGSDYFLEYGSGRRRYSDVKRDVSREPGSFFDPNSTFIVTGSFGWDWVPMEVGTATKLLIADAMSGASDLRQHGVNEAQLGDFSYKLNADQWGTTGNTQADLLLSPYVIMRIGLV